MKFICHLLFFLTILMGGCSRPPLISGTLDLSRGSEWQPKIYLVQPVKWGDVGQSFTARVLDSAVVGKDGYFSFSRLPHMETPALLELTVQKKGVGYPHLLENEDPHTDNYFPLVWKTGESLKIQADISRFQASLSMESPSKANEAILQLRDLRLRAFDAYRESSSNVSDADEALLDREKKLLDYQQELMEFANGTEELLAALLAIRWVSPEGDYERVAEFLYAQAQEWGALKPDHPWVQELVLKADKENLPILQGHLMPQLELPMKNGETLFLDEVLKENKLLLLDVWASWCAPCRIENRNVLLPLWEKYRPDHFQILAYGLESNEKVWANAMERDGAYRWLHASHLLGDQNPLMDALRLKTIPANFLLDSEGRVLAKNLHGAELIQFVEGYMAGPTK
ncbi:TlpA family protein disulfide reductase [Flagellimonas baculiformis]|uniref:TlpA family protein disulfide reductase n=1 Tax=Flagellimonas baculiformis TaxID=3067310 RepID=UPI00296E8A87|nr:TlpA disulfide reductase family protein [Muricauda sp. D6]